MVAFIGNTLRGKVSGENFDESIASCQNLSDFSSVKVLRYTVYHFFNYVEMDNYDSSMQNHSCLVYIPSVGA